MGHGNPKAPCQRFSPCGAERSAAASGLPAPERYQPWLPGTPLKGPRHRRGDPSAVEAPGLGHDPLVTDPARIHAAGVERDVPRDRRERGARAVVAPCGFRLDPLAGVHVEVVGLALPLAERATVGAHQGARHDVVGRQVVVRRMARLENPVRARRLGDDQATELDADRCPRPPRDAVVAGSPTPTPGRAARDQAAGSCRFTRPRRPEQGADPRIDWVRFVALKQSARSTRRR